MISQVKSNFKLGRNEGLWSLTECLWNLLQKVQWRLPRPDRWKHYTCDSHPCCSWTSRSAEEAAGFGADGTLLRVFTSSPGLPRWAFSYFQSGLYQLFHVLLSVFTKCYKHLEVLFYQPGMYWSATWLAQHTLICINSPHVFLPGFLSSLTHHINWIQLKQIKKEVLI